MFSVGGGTVLVVSEGPRNDAGRRQQFPADRSQIQRRCCLYSIASPYCESVRSRVVIRHRILVALTEYVIRFSRYND